MNNLEINGTSAIYKQLGWRLASADELLFTPLIRSAYLHQMHLLKRGETTKKWNEFVDDLFTDQDGFKGENKTSVKCIREQYDARIEQFVKFHGFHDVKMQNNSGMEGDLGDPDKTIKIMLEEQHREEEDKKLKEADNVAIDTNDKQSLFVL